jgi:hypothetical protein
MHRGIGENKFRVKVDGDGLGVVEDYRCKHFLLTIISAALYVNRPSGLLLCTLEQDLPFVRLERHSLRLAG